MNQYKSILLSAFCALILAGCGAQKQAATLSTANLTVVSAPLNITKKAPISDDNLKRWSHLDMVTDTIPGMSVDRAYAEILKDKIGVNVIVGVVDSGVDITHEDLKGKIWINSKEIPDNGIDDDNNGYIDDIHGWNFLGDVENENVELTRIIKKGDDGSEAYKLAKADYDTQLAEALENKEQADFIFNADKTIADFLGNAAYTEAELKTVSSPKATILQSKYVMLNIIAQTGADFHGELKEYKTQVYDKLNYNLNLEMDGRKILGDNPEDIKDTKYGNNIVFGPNPTKENVLHGTHVAGIIAQIRHNDLGGDGVANNVSILVVRAVPNGDEYDKDIALGIRYAVDNGAKVINGSFGKSYSPHKEWVYDAIKYAASKDVLIVHAAGNDGHDIDLAEYKNYPNDVDDFGNNIANNMLTVGALNFTYDGDLVANFSNYGTKNVDVFAPGVKIYATVPNNEYKFEQGTSMASPNVAGVAALIRSYYPKLTAPQVKQILMDSGVTSPLTVKLGETKEVRPFAKASQSGKMVNAYNAFLMADKMSNK